MLKFCLFSILIFVSIVAAINHSAIDGVAVRRKVILDLDTAGLVEGGFDVDDDLALLIALGSREIEIVAITVTYGNAPLEQTLANAKLLCRMANISEESVPIAGGVSWLTRSLLPSNASRLIEQTVLKHDGQVHIIAVGPVTNVAAALHNNKQLENSIASITVMGGDLSPTSIRPFHLHIDLNFMSHRDAINVVLQANVPKLIVTIQTCIAIYFDARLCDSLKIQCGEKPQAELTCAFIEQLLTISKTTPYLVVHKIFTGEGYECRNSPAQIEHNYFYPWDVVALMAFVEPSLFAQFDAYEMSVQGFTTVSHVLPRDDTQRLRGVWNESAVRDERHGAATRAARSTGSLRNVVLVPHGVRRQAFLSSVSTRVCHAPTFDLSPLDTNQLRTRQVQVLAALSLATLLVLISAVVLLIRCVCRCGRQAPHHNTPPLKNKTQ